ncbi:unnamed protein product [Arctia plantaginis]|uniref:Carboxylic ester hydrolase n=1 Tax=Arctia plantaginis TaxID=874455 RepID=A0A8S1B6U4_ARCPL|nr:unnamed protein product [Arctia plantaginis]
MSEAPIVTVEQGQLQGRVGTSPNGKTFFSFQGIPYAKPPIGPLRFKAPQPPEPWQGIYNATAEGNIAPQITLESKYVGEDNCLFLNVYSPKLDGADLPVMVSIHGGGFKFGSGNTDLYGPDYLIEKDVVLVTLNYRCGVLGFLSLNIPEVPGNAGMKDVVQAIRWIKSNIQKFGGDANNITVFGESAGGAAVSFLSVSPLSKPLINKAIIQSGTGLNYFATQKNPLQNARTLAKILGCQSDDPEDIFVFLQGCSTKQIVEAHEQMNPTKFTIVKLNYFTVVFEKEFPGVEGFITESFLDLVTSGRIADIPMMIGFCTLEFIKDEQIPDLQFFIPDEFNLKKDSKESLEIVEKFKHLYLKGDHAEGMARLISDRSIKVDTNRLVKYLVQVTNRPIYFYNFDYVGALNIYDKIMKNPYNHAAHMDDLGYLFKNVFQKDLTTSELDNKVRERMLKLWTNFAKFGNPTPDKDYNLPITWQPVDKDNAYYLNIGSELTLQTDVDKEKMDFWDDLYRKYFRIWEQPKTNSDEVIIKYKPPTNVDTVQAPKEPKEIKTAAAPTVAKVNGESSVPKQDDIETNMKGMVIKASDPPEDDLPKNIGVNKFINFYDSLGKNT